MENEVVVDIRADTEPFETAIENLRRVSASFGDQLAGALKSAAVSGRSLEGVLRRIGLNLAGMTLNRGLQPLLNLASDGFGQLVGGVLPGAAAKVTAFASGGVVGAPTYFGMGRGVGLMGEAGAEAILPLARGSDGRLGVAAGGGGAPVNVVFNVTTPDATSFRKSEAQITGMLARAVSRGARTL